jgi:cellulose synthase/poly-beta-1,6-N-acetylglucosamine synthase-like glycosyltransferase
MGTALRSCTKAQKFTKEFIAIFDADFIPSLIFLRKTVPVLNQRNRIVANKMERRNRE